MRQTSTSRRTLIAILTLCSDTGESGEAYDMDVQSPSCPRNDSLSTLDRSFTIRSSRAGDSESGEAYEAEVEARRRDKLSEEPSATTNPMDG